VFSTVSMSRRTSKIHWHGIGRLPNVIAYLPKIPRSFRLFYNYAIPFFLSIVLFIPSFFHLVSGREENNAPRIIQTSSLAPSVPKYYSFNVYILIHNDESRHIYKTHVSDIFESTAALKQIVNW
jgi:hypothetical protein